MRLRTHARKPSACQTGNRLEIARVGQFLAVSALLHGIGLAFAWHSPKAQGGKLEHVAIGTPMARVENVVAVEPLPRTAPEVAYGLVDDSAPIREAPGHHHAEPANKNPTKSTATKDPDAEALTARLSENNRRKSNASQRQSGNGATLSATAASRSTEPAAANPERNTASNVREGTTADDLKQAMLAATTHNLTPSGESGFGTMEMLMRERNFERALTWVFPKVASQDKAYWRWPMGSLGSIRFFVTLSQNGKIIDSRFDSDEIDSRLAPLVTKMLRFLAPGRFSLGGEPRDGSVERSFLLSVRHDKSAKLESSTALAVPKRSDGGSIAEIGNIARIGFEPPQPGKPGHGYIEDETGQELSADLRELNGAAR